MKITIPRILLSMIFATTIYLIARWNVSANQIQDLCKNAKQDQQVSEITETLKDSWLLQYKDSRRNGNNAVFVYSGASFGRYTCAIEYKDGKVMNVDYNFFD